MLSKFSVKRPYLIIVAVVIALILGGVSLSRMHTNLLPKMDLPYLAVITTDPGASSEKVEEEVTQVLEGPLSTISGVEATASSSADNVSMIFIQFQDGTDMDSAMVKASTAVNQVAGQLPENAGQPNYLEMSMDMMASMYVAASYEGKDIYQTSDAVKDTVLPELRRMNNLSDVRVSGDIETSVEIRLDEKKIKAINDKVKAEVTKKLDESKKELDDARTQLQRAETELAAQESSLNNTQSTTANQVGTATAGLTSGLASAQGTVASLNAQKTSLEAQLQTTTNAAVRETLQKQIDKLESSIKTAEKQASDLQKQLSEANAGAISTSATMSSGTNQLASTRASLEQQKAQLDQAESDYKASREEALKNANIDKITEKKTLSQLLAAQDLNMPAGYVEDKTEDQWLVRVGDTFESTEELGNLLITNVDGVGDIKLKDIAQIVEVDNVGETYAKVNGEDGVILSLYKNSTASASELSEEARGVMAKLEAENPGLHLDIASDQGSYISRYITNILWSLLIGAILALVVLALFLRSWKPTIIVAFSIPFSVLLALLFMFFTGIDINIMSLGGISIAIGMLVDNSIIALENIYRLRARGIAPARAAAQGAKQITGAVIASTLTTICVFLPIVFTTGMVNQLMLPFALTVGYVLAASLLVALTLVPAVSSFVLRNHVPREIKWFEGLRNKYARSLNFALNHKVLPLLIAVVLLGISVMGVLNMGIVMIPTMTSSTAEVVVTVPEGTEKDKAFETADQVMSIAQGIEGVETVGAIDAASGVSVMGMGDASSSGNSRYHEVFEFYIRMGEEVNTEQQVLDILQQIQDQTSELNCEVVTEASDSSSMSSMLGVGLDVSVKGDDPEKLEAISEDVMGYIEQIPGYTEIENGMEDATYELNVVINRDKLTKAGGNVAQIYSDLADKISTESTVTTMTLNEKDMEVKVIDETNKVTKENLLNTAFEITNSSTGETKAYELRDFAKVEQDLAAPTVQHEDGVRVMHVTADVEDGYNNALLSRSLQTLMAEYEVPEGYSVEFGGELDNINTMLEQMLLLLLLGFILIYLVMVAQFQSLLSPFIIILTVPLAFTGGFLGLVAGQEQLSMLSLMGFALLMGTVVNNGIVFVDFVNQMRRGGMPKREALLAAGRARIRPILMTALTTILAMLPLVFSWLIGASMQRGMALVVTGGLLYATFMTLYIVPIMYDLLYRKVPKEVDVGSDMERDVEDAQALLDELRAIGLTKEHMVFPELVGGVRNPAAAVAGAGLGAVAAGVAGAGAAGAAGARTDTAVMQGAGAGDSSADTTGLDIMSTGEAIDPLAQDGADLGLTMATSPIDTSDPGVDVPVDAEASSDASGAADVAVEAAPERKTPTPVKPEGGLPAAYSPKRDEAMAARKEAEADAADAESAEDSEPTASATPVTIATPAEPGEGTAAFKADDMRWATPAEQDSQSITVVPCGPADVDPNTGELTPVGTREEILEQHSGQIPAVTAADISGSLGTPEEFAQHGPRSIEMPDERPSIFNTGSFSGPIATASEVAEALDSEKDLRQSEKEARKAERAAAREQRKAEREARRAQRKAEKEAKKAAKGKPKSPTRD